MLRLRYSAASKDDLKEIARFIAKDKPIAARQWVEKIREKCRLAANHPELVPTGVILVKVFGRRTWEATTTRRYRVSGI